MPDTHFLKCFQSGAQQRRLSDKLNDISRDDTNDKHGKHDKQVKYDKHGKQDEHQPKNNEDNLFDSNIFFYFAPYDGNIFSA